MSTALLIACCVLLFCFLITGFLCLQSRRELGKYSDIVDAESYLNDCKTNADLLTSERDQAASELQLSIEKLREVKEFTAQQEADTQKRINAEIQDHNDQITKLKALISGYLRSIKAIKKAEDIKEYIQQLSKYAKGCKSVRDLEEVIKKRRSLIGELSIEIEELSSLLGSYKNLYELDNKIKHHTVLANQLNDDIEQLGFTLESVKDVDLVAKQLATKKRELKEIRKEILEIEEVKELQEFGFYQRKYDYDTAAKYKAELDIVRSIQKQMVRSKTAATCDAEWVVEGSRAKGKEMTRDQIKLLLRSFNGESDAAIAKVNFSNATSMEKRINKSFKQINGMGNVNKVIISSDYLKFKLDELYLTHEHKVQKEEEKEEQKRIRQIMKEEQKTKKEIEKATREAELDEAEKQSALEQARKELFEQHGHHNAKLSRLVEKLETELQEALDRKSKAIARAQLTKSGHVYVLSNIGSFGENVYKIGVTRRLEPLERVKELGSASVPFLFDLHAMIYSENAPKLEKKLHRHFESRRVNIVNARKEFFRVTLDEIMEAVDEHFGEVTFITEAEAPEYRQTVARLAEIEDEGFRNAQTVLNAS